MVSSRERGSFVTRPPVRPGHPLRAALRWLASPYASRRGRVHNYRHSRACGNPGGGANGDLKAKRSLDSADIELCKEPEGEGPPPAPS